MRLFTIGILKESREMNNDYKKAQFKKMVAEADLSLSCSDCPLIEYEALVWADKRIIELEAALNKAMVAMRAPLDGWKGEVERLALDLAKSVLNEKAGSNNWQEDV